MRGCEGIDDPLSRRCWIIYLIWGKEGIDALREHIPLAKIIMPAICLITLGFAICVVGVAIKFIGVIFDALFAIFQALSAKRIKAIKHLLFSFHGRISRRMWWLTALLFFVYAFGVAELIGLLFDPLDVITKTPLVVDFLSLVFVLSYVWMGSAIGAKRLHDRNLSGWWVLVLPLFELASVFIHVLGVGSIIFFVYLGCVRGDSGTNGYGDPPPQSLNEWWDC